MLPEIFGKTFADIAQYLAAIKEEPVGSPYAAYYNMDMQNLDVEIGFPVSKPLPSKGEIQPGQIPAGKFAACLYTGPYGDIEPAYTALSAWIKEQGHVVTGVAYELYLNDPGHTPPQQLQTQILFPLMEAS
jgi:effector-binding domain-containing protein